jgi:hypothetical protein
MAQFLPTVVVSVFVLRATHRAMSWTVHRCLFIQAGANAGRAPEIGHGFTKPKRGYQVLRMAGRCSDSEGRKNESLWDSLVEAGGQKAAVRPERQKTRLANPRCSRRGIKTLTGRLSRLVSKDGSRLILRCRNSGDLFQTGFGFRPSLKTEVGDGG